MVMKVVDFGTYTEESCDYPDYASKAAKAVADGTCDKGGCCMWNWNWCQHYCQ